MNQYKTSAQLKALAKESLMGKYPVAVVATLLYTLITYIITEISSVFLLIPGIFGTILMMLSYVEYAFITPINIIITAIMYTRMLVSPQNPEDAQCLHMLIFSIYSFICNTRAFISVGKLYKEQQNSVIEQLAKNSLVSIELANIGLFLHCWIFSQ